MNYRLLARLAMLLMLAACANEAEAPLVASDVGVNRGPAMSAAYMTLTNNSSENISVTQIRSPNYESVEIHETTVENDIARMRRVDNLLIPAHDSARLEPGGKHLMLMQPVGNDATVIFNIYSGDTLLLSVNAVAGDR